MTSPRRARRPWDGHDSLRRARQERGISMNCLRQIKVAALCAVLVATPMAASAENWGEVGDDHYMQVDLDSIHRASAGMVYFTWKFTWREAGSPPHATAVDCERKLTYPDITEPEWLSKGIRHLDQHSVRAGLLDFVCRTNAYPGFQWTGQATGQ